MITHTYLDSLTWSLYVILYDFGGVLMGLALKLSYTICLLQFVYLFFSTQFLNCQEAVEAGVPVHSWIPSTWKAGTERLGL